VANNLQVGNSGLFVSELIFGTALTVGTEITHQRSVDELIHRAFDLSVTSFDTASNYGEGNAEVMLGKSLKHFERQDYVLMTKAGWPSDKDKNFQGMGRKNIIHSVEKSLKSLKMDYIDVLFSHRFVKEISIEELVVTMNNLIKEGKILHWGTSQWPVEALNECGEICEKLGLEKPIVEQPVYSFIARDIDRNGVREYCENNKIGIFGFSPLAQGILSGKYQNGIPRSSRIEKGNKLNYTKTTDILLQNKIKVQGFLDSCRLFGVNPISASLQFSRRNGVIPIVGSTDVKQIEENVQAARADVPIEFWNAIIKDDKFNI
jgi:aryl-alcohol dehydrogenase-like predicted oxidoreductase